MGLVQSLLGFLLAMGILVAVHEYGHFYVARRLGVKVLVFSLGFGRLLWRHIGKDGVEYRLSLIPLGGYVRMLDEREGEVAEAERRFAFNNQALWKRAAIVAAGPFYNFVLGFLFFYVVLLFGYQDLRPEVAPTANSPLAIAGLQKGDLITSIDQKPVLTMTQATTAFVEALGDGEAEIVVERKGQPLRYHLQLGQPLEISGQTDLYGLLGLYLNIPSLPAVIGGVVPDGPADLAGLKPNDKIIEINGQLIDGWRELYNTTRALVADQPVEVRVRRSQGETVTLSVTPTYSKTQNAVIMGIEAQQDEQFIADSQAAFERLTLIEHYNPLQAIGVAAYKVYDNSLLIFRMIGRLFTGQVKLSAMGGPITIADVSGKVLASGFVNFMYWLGILSVNLAVMNLLPVPVLDGGRLVGYAIEAIVGKGRIPAVLSTLTLQLGLVFILFFMSIVIFYEILRQFGLQ